jgi:hypothetical protein
MKESGIVYIGIPTYDGRVHKNLANAQQKATANELGAKLYATREVAIRHAGSTEYPNTSAWGSLREDAAGE